MKNTIKAVGMGVYLLLIGWIIIQPDMLVTFIVAGMAIFNIFKYSQAFYNISSDNNFKNVKAEMLAEDLRVIYTPATLYVAKGMEVLLLAGLIYHSLWPLMVLYFLSVVVSFSVIHILMDID